MKLLIPEFLKPLLETPAAVFGAGVSGHAVQALLENIGGGAVIYDESGRDGALTEFKVSNVQQHRLVVVSPGFAPSHPWLAAARSKGCVCLGELDLASLFWRGGLVAITGTNGKTTLTEFLAHALNLVGREAYTAGNIGRPLCQLVVESGGGSPDAIAVCEVSSFQAEGMRYFRPDSVIWTNFAEDHLERHGTMEAYFMAKWHLLERSVGGSVYVGSSVQKFAPEFGQNLPEDACVNTCADAGDVLLRETAFAEMPQLENFLLAAAWWRGEGLREVELYAAARSFRLADHRLQHVAEIGGVHWWNDSKATNFHAVEGALARFNQPVILIAGGRSKGGDVSGFVQRIASRLKHVFLIGETRNVLATFCGVHGVDYTLCNNLSQAVVFAAELSCGGDHVLLSPGFASFDQFSGYADRGNQFVRLVREIGSRDSEFSTNLTT